MHYVFKRLDDGKVLGAHYCGTDTIRNLWVAYYELTFRCTVYWEIA